MPTIFYATSNKDKVRVAQNSLGPQGFEVKQLEMDLPETQSFGPAEVAKYSARVAAEKSGWNYGTIPASSD